MADRISAVKYKFFYISIQRLLFSSRYYIKKNQKVNHIYNSSNLHSLRDFVEKCKSRENSLIDRPER
jgi:hypothetical protein